MRPDELKPRARQNVILELGQFYWRAWKKECVCFIQEDIETPSDYVGVLYKKMDNDGAWRFELAKEMKSAGLNIDLNKLA